MKRRIRYIGTRLIASAAFMIALLVGALSVVTFMMHRDDLMESARLRKQRSENKGALQGRIRLRTDAE